MINFVTLTGYHMQQFADRISGYVLLEKIKL